MSDDYAETVSELTFFQQQQGFDIAKQPLYIFETAVLDGWDDPWNAGFGRELRRLMRLFRVYPLTHNMAVYTLYVGGWRAVANWETGRINILRNPLWSTCVPNTGYCAPAC